MASPAYAAVTSVAGGFKTGAQNIAVPASGSNAANDLMLIFVYKETLSAGVTSTNFLKPSDGSSGFDEVAASSSHSLYVGYKRLTTGDTGNYSVNVGGDNSWTEMVAIKVTGCITSGNPWDIINSAVSGGSVTAAPNAAVTTTVPDTLLAYAATNITGGAWTVASGMTERYDAGGDITVDTLAQAATGSSGNKSATCAGSGRSISWLGALKSPSTSTSATAESASLTVAANSATVAVTATAESASVTVAAYDATVSTSADVSATAESASLTVAANAATVAMEATAGAPSITVVANDAVAAVKPAAESASLTVTAYDATISNSPPTPDVTPGIPWVVRAAPGHDIATEEPSAMTWYDVTDRVRGQISLRVGRETQGGDSRACELHVTLESNDGLLVPTLVTSEWWPDVVKGMPLQFWRCDSAGVPDLRCTVAADAINPTWPNGLDGDCEVVITASGFMRWMDQGQKVSATATVTSAIAATPLALWPLTDADGSTTGASALAGGQPMTRTTSDVRFGQVLGPDGVTKFPSLETSGRLSGNVPVTAVTDRWSTQLLALVESAATDWWTVAMWSTTSTTAPTWRLRWDGPTGPTTLRWIAPDGAETTVVTVAASPIGSWHRVAVYCVQSGGNVSCTVYIDGAVAGTGTATGVTTGRVTTITAGDYDGPGSGMVSVGDVSVWDTQVDASGSYTSQTGYDGELAHVRWLRLLSEAGIPASCDAVTSVRMGPQMAGSLVDAVNACVDTDGGIQTDEPSRGLRYVATSEMYNQAAAITLDARADGGHLAGAAFGATFDDSRTATDVTITREGGGSRRVAVPSARTYTDSDTLSLYTDDLARAIASWRAHHGAQEVLRYETISWDAVKVVDTAVVPVLLDDTLALRPGHRIVITGLPTPHPDEDVSLILQGWTEVHELDTFHVAAKVGPARLFEIATVGSDDPGDWDDTTWRIDSDTSSVGGGGVNTTAVSIVVASGYGWSTTDVPYNWDVGGEKIRVDSITAYSGGTQTATVVRSVNGVVKAHAAGTAITLYRPPVIGL